MWKTRLYVSSVAFSPDGFEIASGSADGKIRIYCFKTFLSENLMSLNFNNRKYEECLKNEQPFRYEPMILEDPILLLNV